MTAKPAMPMILSAKWYKSSDRAFSQHGYGSNGNFWMAGR
jgi:hypothetical protein